MIAWLKDYLAAQLKDKESFMTNFVGEITPRETNLIFDEEKKTVNITFNFLIEDEDEAE